MTDRKKKFLIIAIEPDFIPDKVNAYFKYIFSNRPKYQR